LKKAIRVPFTHVTKPNTKNNTPMIIKGISNFVFVVHSLYKKIGYNAIYYRKISIFIIKENITE
jgi:hypothetical protein